MAAVQRAAQLEGQLAELRGQGQDAADAAEAARSQLAEATTAADSGAAELDAARQQVDAGGHSFRAANTCQSCRGFLRSNFV